MRQRSGARAGGTIEAPFLLSIDFEKGDRRRMVQLAEKSEAGTLTPEDQAEFDGYLHVGNLLTVIQSKARRALKRKPHDCLLSVNREVVRLVRRQPKTGEFATFLLPYIRYHLTLIT